MTYILNGDDMASIISNQKVEKRIMGSEGIIYIYSDKVYKKFLSSVDVLERENKKNKLLLLDELKLDEYYNKIYALVYEKFDYLSGYIVEKIDGEPLSKTKYDMNLKINILKQIKEILEIFKTNDIDYIDINLSNIFYTSDSKIKFIDMDNIKIKNYDIDTLPISYKNYYNLGGYNIENAKKFVFNAISLLYLLDLNRIDDIRNLKIYQKELSFLNKEARKICNDLLNLKIGSSCDNEYLIDLIDEKILKK